MAAAYPASIKSFLTYYDQPPGPTKTAPNPTPPPSTLDLTIDRAVITNEIHDEVLAMEETIGVSSTARWAVIPGTKSLNDEVLNLYNGKAWGQVDPHNNAIYPAPPAVGPAHNHLHSQLSELDEDVHPQYMRVDGGRAFGAPCPGQDAVSVNQLVTLQQVLNGEWVNSPQVVSIIETEIAEEAAFPMIAGTSGGIDYSQRYRMTGGLLQGYTDSNGRIRIDYTAANFRGILTLVYMKMPFPGPSAYGYTYQYEEDQLILAQVDNQGAWIQFNEDVVVDRQAWVAMTWMVVGV